MEFGFVSKLFHRQSSLSTSKGQGESDWSTWPKEWTTIYFKQYPRMPRHPLPNPKAISMPLERVFDQRHSNRDFSSIAVTQEELSTLLYYAAGINPKTKKTNADGTIDWDSTRRFYPSGGARCPLEVYVVAQNVSGMERGVYHYNVKEHILEKLLGGEVIEEFNHWLIYSWSKGAPVTVIISSMWDRDFIKYADLGYRFMMIETGGMLDQFYLTSAALGLGVCATAGFNTAAIDRFLDIDRNEKESTVLMVCIGKNP